MPTAKWLTSAWLFVWKRCSISHPTVSQPDPLQQAASADSKQNAALPCLRDDELSIQVNRQYQSGPLSYLTAISSSTLWTYYKHWQFRRVQNPFSHTSHHQAF